MMVFATGAEAVPVLGFEHPPQITFDHDDDSPTKDFPVANTCVLSLRLPLIKDYVKFSTNCQACFNVVQIFTNA